MQLIEYVSMECFNKDEIKDCVKQITKLQVAINPLLLNSLKIKCFVIAL